MTSRKLKKLLHERPFLIDNCFLLSNTEAALLIKKHGYPDLTQVIARAKAKADIPYAAWNKLDILIEERSDAGFIHIVKEHIRKASMVLRFHKRLAVICLVLLMLVGFFGFVPAGRALAAEAYHIVLRLINNVLVTDVHSESSDDNCFTAEYGTEIPDEVKNTILDSEQSQAQSFTTTEYKNIAEFTENTGLIPIVLNEEWVAFQSVEYVNNPTVGNFLYISYVSDTSAQITTTQIWNSTSDMQVSNHNDSFHLYTSQSGYDVYYTIDSMDNSIFTEAEANGTILIIAAKGNVTVDNILALYDQLR